MMLFKSSAHLLLWAFAIVVVVVLGLLAVDVGLGGSAAQDWLRDWGGFLAKHYGLNRANIQLGLQIIGLAFSIVIGMLGFLRALHYAEIFLPQRIADYIALGDERHLVDRGLLLAPFATRTLSEAPSPTIEHGLLRQVARFVGLDWRQRLTKRLNNGLPQLDDAIGVIEKRKQSCETQKATVHLMRGLDLAAKAALVTSDSDAQRQKNRDALQEFEKVLRLNENDLDGLEQAARQSRLLKSEVPAVHYLKRMARAAAASNKPVLQARSMRFQAEIFDEYGTPVYLNRARASLEAAIRELEGVIDISHERDAELAMLHEQLGAVQTKREKYGKAERALAEAQRRYNALSDANGVSRIKTLMDRLAKDKEDGEEPDHDDTGSDDNGATA